jgi:hypothetical protein
MVVYIIVESRKGDTSLRTGGFYTAFVMQYKKYSFRNGVFNTTTRKD